MTFNKHYFCSMQINKKTDEYFMQKALQEAQIAFDLDEVPVGAVITCEDQIIARAHNYMFCQKVNSESKKIRTISTTVSKYC